MKLITLDEVYSYYNFWQTNEEFKSKYFIKWMPFWQFVEHYKTQGYRII